MKIKIPNKINAGAYEFSISYFKGLAKHAGALGQSMAGEGAIWIDPDEKEMVKLVTLYHEIIHSICDVERLKLADDDIDRIAQCLARIFRDDFGIELDWENIK